MRRKRALKNIVVSLLLQIVSIICGFIVPKLIISNYGSATNGLISSITQFLGYILLLDAGVGQVVKSLLYKPIANKDKEEVQNLLAATQRFYNFIIKIFVLYMVAMCIFYPLVVNNQFDTFYTVSLIVVISLSSLFEYYFGMVYKTYLFAEQKQYIVSYLQMGTTVLNAIFVVILVRLNASIQIVKLFSAFIYILRPLFQNIYVRKKYRISLKHVDKNYEIKQKWDGLSQHIANLIHNNTDVIVLTLFLRNVLEISVYSVYMLVVKGVRSLVEALSSGIDATFGDMIARNEVENLNKKFDTYEFIYNALVTIVYASTLLLINAFVGVYTRGITDVLYVRPLFSIFLVTSEFIRLYRLPYLSLVFAAGKFKDTTVGSWVEAGMNVALSVILVIKFGMVGVVIATCLAMLYRTIDIIVYSSHHILQRSALFALKSIVLIIVEVLTIQVIASFIPIQISLSYINWIKTAFTITFISTSTVAIYSIILFNKELMNLINVIFDKIKKRGEPL